MLVRVQGKPNRLLCVIALAICLLVSPVRGQELDAAWFKANYLPAAQKLEKAYAECSANLSQTNRNDKSDDYNTATFHFAFDGTRRKFDRTIESHKDGSTYKRSRTIVASPEVSFMVFTKQEKDPLLETVNRSPLALAQATRQIDSWASDSIYAPFMLLDKRVSQQIQDKDFEIKSVKREGDRVRLDFHVKKDDFQADAWVVLLPSRQWVIDRWDISLKVTKPTEYSYRVVSAMSYGDDNPVPALTGSTTTTYHPDRTDSDKMVVDKLTFAAAPASEFKLSSYGYDDRIGLPAGPFGSFWFWLAAGGFACLLIAFVIRRIMAKRAAA